MRHQIIVRLKSLSYSHWPRIILLGLSNDSGKSYHFEVFFSRNSYFSWVFKWFENRTSSQPVSQGSPSIENSAHGIEKSPLKTQVSEYFVKWSQFNNIFNS